MDHSGYFRRGTICMLLLLAGMLLSAQKAPEKFGAISMADMEMSRYEKDTGAPALVLFDYGNAYFVYSSGISLIMEVHVRIKILKKEGYNYADVSIPYTPDNKVMSFRASTYNLVDGKIVQEKVKNDLILHEEVVKGRNLMKISFPNVREGSVIEYSYSMESGTVYELSAWNFQWRIPCRWNELSVTVPEYFRYKIISQGYNAFQIAEKIPGMTMGSIPTLKHRWVMKEVPAFKPEPYMPPDNNFISRLSFELEQVNIPGMLTRNFIIDWPAFNKNLLEFEDLGQAIEKNGFLKEGARQVTAGITDRKAQLAALYRYVAGEVEWDEKYGSIYASATLQKIWKEKKGKASDINLLLIAMLRAGGFDAHPLLLSSRANGFIRNLNRPVMNEYDYVVACVKLDEEEILLDATDPLLPFNFLPLRCMNDQGRLLHKDNSKWVKLCRTEKYDTYTMANLVVDEEGNLRGSLSIMNRGYDALDKRAKLKKDGEEKYIKDLMDEHGNWEIVKYEFRNAENPDEPLIESYELVISDLVQMAGNIIYLNPMLAEGLKENPFKLETRVFPVDFSTPLDQVYLLNIQIPGDYLLSSTPAEVNLSLAGRQANFKYMVRQNGPILQVMSNLSIKKSMFIQSEYPEIKELYSRMLEKHQEQVVLQRTADRP